MAGRTGRRWAVVLLVLLGCGTMAWAETLLRPAYPVKSALKLLVFLGAVGLYVLLCQDKRPLRAFRRPDGRSLKQAGLLSLAAFVGILGGYALLSPWIDLSAIPGNLAAKEGLTAATFPLAALYISFINSLLEEIFFRGFAFLTLRETGKPALAWGFSALAFALYHVCIMGSWFHPVLFVLLTAALAMAGLLFNWLDRWGSLWPAWLVHMAANLATNIIGMGLLGIL